MIRDRFSEKLQTLLGGDEWLILQDEYDAAENLNYESLFCLTNGYLGTRGSYEEGTVKSLPCTFVNGVFDKSETFMRELANLPNWLGIRLYVEKELIGIENCSILEFSRVLDMKHAMLVKRFLLEDKKGRQTLVEGIRFVSRANVHRMAVKLYVTPINYDGIIEVENIVDGSVINFADAPRFKVKHTYLVANERLTENGVYIECATRDNHLHVGTGAFLDAERNGKSVIKTRQFYAFGEQTIEFQDFDAEQGVTTEITKYASIYTERDLPKYELHSAVKNEIDAFVERGFEQELAEHFKVYEEMWKEADIQIQGDFDLDRAVRFNIFHLMSTGNEHDDRVNVGAKLLHGEEYGGHAFWDTELFMLPFFAYVFPKTAKNLESYRYRLLDAARANAAKNGYKGAQYPWESADDGTEQCPDWTIEPDGTCYRCYVADYEHHVTAAVAYGIYDYVKITMDTSFLSKKGAEILMETARFWASRCEYITEKDRYEIRKVTGPDEWHEPVDNNVYTNYLAKWNLRYVIALIQDLKEHHREDYDRIAEKISLTEKEIEEWNMVQSKIYLPRKEGTQLLEQFEGYFDLQEVTIQEYDKNDWPIRPAELKTMKTKETQIIKQADVVMLLHLMGGEFDEETTKLNYSYYEKRTLHGSSLSPSIYSIMGLKVGDDTKAYRYLRRAAFIDLINLQKNTREGIHAANAGGVWQTVVFGFAGLSIDADGILNITPKMPKEWEGVTFRIHYLNSWLEISIDAKNNAAVKVLEGAQTDVKVNGKLMRV
ncbi:glycoside hydrolase family 65 protein [Faecalimonas umbilicata]|uniref:glycoside hydrolase family 65 protein n=1 Tax=Faecalimonas umbilicata TaxID=1912855 RepID=UPI002A7F9D0F|nr:glycosyl hydrolase family 65 protein [Faecalimonas umbilicata]MDY4596390.1 glycosyl hydrolase family 65 protein [Faecalimonas umbilicata]